MDKIKELFAEALDLLTAKASKAESIANVAVHGYVKDFIALEAEADAKFHEATAAIIAKMEEIDMKVQAMLGPQQPAPLRPSSGATPNVTQPQA